MTEIRCPKPSYTDLVEEAGIKVLVNAEEKGYQGMGYCIVAKDGRYGYLSYRYGSCSGCDAIEDSNTEDLDQIRKELVDDIDWYDTPEEVITDTVY
jgi:hypothetical protein